MAHPPRLLGPEGFCDPWDSKRLCRTRGVHDILFCQASGLYSWLVEEHLAGCSAQLQPGYAGIMWLLL